ncbi:MAG: hypothetical protein EZS28_002055 [Streblomastix strix]|uniref:Uncharacterized protein n=1 Tax=Streblomastix strix TaxID=222440 RepID=A0A5J4X6C6_9EUKA|nr:MAG: hypothetical protein EZS28_002055 [Streblomastix strix]
MSLVIDIFVPPKMILVKCKRDESQLAYGQSLNSLQAQFQQHRLQYYKFNSLADQKITQDFVTMFEGVFKKPASKIDMLNYTPEPITRLKFFHDISWNGANIIFPNPEVGPIQKKEGPWYARRQSESSAAVTQGMATLINDAARNETDNLVGKLHKVFEASLISVADAQLERESRLDDAFQEPRTEDVLSQHTEKRYKKNPGKQINIGRRKYGSTFGKYISQNRGKKRQNKRNFQFQPRGRFNREYKAKTFKSSSGQDQIEDKYSP